MKKLYYITTYGCQLNVHESEKLAGVLEGLGFTCATSLEEADVIVFNTCAIRAGAEDRAFGNIGALKRLKKENPSKIIAVCGCMTQSAENAEYVYKTFPFVDIIFGTANLYLFKQFLENHNGKHKMYHSDEYNLLGEDMPKFRTSGENAWVNIMQGCNNFCTYCIVPYVRGRERSRSKEDILAEIKDLISSGKYKKITLLGQNVNSYGNDTKQCNFATLLKEICALEGDFKLTFMTSHPKDFSSEVIDIIKTENKMLKEIHLPVQSGSSKILRAMNRGYTREKYLGIIDEIKQKIPNIKLSTDIIVGFPNESEEDFQETITLLKYVQYDNVFAFMYSPRAGTPAAKMAGQIDQKIKNLRVNEVLACAKEFKKKEVENVTNQRKNIKNDGAISPN
ncbi:MAG: tRNA (N6-isopentenyl adenosine(37)-C2)-methylthiotransferase MiaB [Clostridia bacterium]|nr:tRNA (N6-isopentenyl adenosine(37)-C2)-methylthiotransferase MiaB [Clostridia bacterium]